MGIENIKPDNMTTDKPIDRRALVLLKATYDMLKKCDESHFVISPITETVFYDDADCDGSCLMEDIEHFLEWECDAKGKDK